MFAAILVVNSCYLEKAVISTMMPADMRLSTGNRPFSQDIDQTYITPSA